MICDVCGGGGWEGYTRDGSVVRGVAIACVDIRHTLIHPSTRPETYARGERAADGLGVVRVDELGPEEVEEEAARAEARQDGAGDEALAVGVPLPACVCRGLFGGLFFGLFHGCFVRRNVFSFFKSTIASMNQQPLGRTHLPATMGAV